MHAFLIVGRNSVKIEANAGSIAKKHGYNLVPYEISKISDIRDLSNFLSFKRDKIALFISNVHLLTPEAANAFLKTLEEVQEGVIFILGTPNENLVVPTIMSRCQLIRLNDKQDADIDSARDFIRLKAEEKWEKMQGIKERSEALAFMEKLIFDLNGYLVAGENIVATAKILKAADKTLLAIKANANVPLALANFVING